jgi:hypothetical protein
MAATSAAAAVCIDTQKKKNKVLKNQQQLDLVAQTECHEAPTPDGLRDSEEQQQHIILSSTLDDTRAVIRVAIGNSVSTISSAIIVPSSPTVTVTPSGSGSGCGSSPSVPAAVQIVVDDTQERLCAHEWITPDILILASDRRLLLYHIQVGMHHINENKSQKPGHKPGHTPASATPPPPSPSPSPSQSPSPSPSLPKITSINAELISTVPMPFGTSNMASWQSYQSQSTDHHDNNDINDIKTHILAVASLHGVHLLRIEENDIESYANTCISPLAHWLPFKMVNCVDVLHANIGNNEVVPVLAMGTIDGRFALRIIGEDVHAYWQNIQWGSTPLTVVDGSTTRDCLVWNGVDNDGVLVGSLISDRIVSIQTADIPNRIALSFWGLSVLLLQLQCEIKKNILHVHVQQCARLHDHDRQLSRSSTTDRSPVTTDTSTSTANATATAIATDTDTDTAASASDNGSNSNTNANTNTSESKSQSESASTITHTSPSAAPAAAPAAVGTDTKTSDTQANAPTNSAQAAAAIVAEATIACGTYATWNSAGNMLAVACPASSNPDCINLHVYWCGTGWVERLKTINITMPYGRLTGIFQLSDVIWISSEQLALAQCIPWPHYAYSPSCSLVLAVDHRQPNVQLVADAHCMDSVHMQPDVASNEWLCIEQYEAQSAQQLRSSQRISVPFLDPRDVLLAKTPDESKPIAAALLLETAFATTPVLWAVCPSACAILVRDILYTFNCITKQWHMHHCGLSGAAADDLDLDTDSTSHCHIESIDIVQVLDKSDDTMQHYVAIVERSLTKLVLVHVQWHNSNSNTECCSMHAAQAHIAIGPQLVEFNSSRGDETKKSAAVAASFYRTGGDNILWCSDTTVVHMSAPDMQRAKGPSDKDDGDSNGKAVQVLQQEHKKLHHQHQRGGTEEDTNELSLPFLPGIIPSAVRQPPCCFMKCTLELTDGGDQVSSCQILVTKQAQVSREQHGKMTVGVQTRDSSHTQATIVRVQLEFADQEETANNMTTNLCVHAASITTNEVEF